MASPCASGFMHPLNFPFLSLYVLSARITERHQDNQPHPRSPHLLFRYVNLNDESRKESSISLDLLQLRWWRRGAVILLGPTKLLVCAGCFQPCELSMCGLLAQSEGGRLGLFFFIGVC